MDTEARRQERRGTCGRGRRRSPTPEEARRPAHDNLGQRKGIRLPRENRKETGSGILFRQALPLLRQGREREHERTRTAISAQGDGFRERHSGGRQEN